VAGELGVRAADRRRNAAACDRSQAGARSRSRPLRGAAGPRDRLRRGPPGPQPGAAADEWPAFAIRPLAFPEPTLDYQARPSGAARGPRRIPPHRVISITYLRGPPPRRGEWIHPRRDVVDAR